MDPKIKERAKQNGKGTGQKKAVGTVNLEGRGEQRGQGEGGTDPTESHAKGKRKPTV